MLSLKHPPSIITRSLEAINLPQRFSTLVVCGARGPRPRYPRVWKTRKRIGTISKSQKLVDCVIKWMLSKGQGKTMGTYFTLLNALAEDGRLEEAEELWMKIFSENLESLPRVFFIKMISIYYARGMNEKMFEVFADMEELGIRPDQSIVRMVGDVFQNLGMLDKYEKLNKKYPPSTWEYRYIKGKRVKIQVKQLNAAVVGEAGDSNITADVEEAGDHNISANVEAGECNITESAG